MAAGMALAASSFGLAALVQRRIDHHAANGADDAGSTSKNEVSVLWQVPQYVVITAGEILFSVTGKSTVSPALFFPLSNAANCFAITQALSLRLKHRPTR